MSGTCEEIEKLVDRLELAYKGGRNIMIIVLCLSIIAGTLLCGIAQLLEWIDRTYNDYKLLKTVERWWKL